MAYELNLDQDEEKKNEQAGQAPQAQSGGTLIAGGGGETGLSGGGAAPGAANPYANVKEFLDANQEQAKGLAGKISGKITGEGNQVRGSIDTTKNQFGQAVNQNTVNLDRNLVDQAKNQSAQFVQNQNNVSAFKNMRDATYKGPNDLMDYNNSYATLQGQAKKAMERGGLVDTDAGRQTLIGEVSRRPSAGKSALDNILLSQNKDALGTLQSAKADVMTLQDYLDQANTAARGLSDQGKSTTAQTRATIQDEFKGEKGVIPGLQAAAQTKLAQERAGADALTKQAQAAVNNLDWKNISGEALSALGLSRNEFRDFAEKNARAKALDKSGVNLGDYFKALNPEAELDIANVTSKDEQAQAAALASLFDEATPYLPQSDKAGTASRDLVSLNKEDAISRLNQMLKNAEEDRLVKELGDEYYTKVGQHTGQGTAGAYNGRDTEALIRDVLRTGRQLTPDEEQRFFGNYENGNDSIKAAHQEFLEKLGIGKQDRKKIDSTMNYNLRLK